MDWLKLSATIHEHPKVLAVRSGAGSRADSAELGWYRLLMAARRYGRWAFASEAHLEHAAGAYYRFVPLYREAGLLDGLAVHDGDSYNAVRSQAERKADQRERDSVSRSIVTPSVTPERDSNVTLDRESRETEKSREESADRDALDRFYELTGWNPWTMDWRRDELKVMQNDYGIASTIAALDAEWNATHDRKGLTKGAAARLARDTERAKEAKRAANGRHKPRLTEAELQQADHDRAVLAHALMTGEVEP